MKLSAKKIVVASSMAILFSSLHAAEREKGFRVDYRDAAHRQILIEVPGGESVTGHEDFAVLSEGGDIIAWVYPFQILKGRFWSQPLNAETFEKIPSAATVKRTALGRNGHRGVRDAGDSEWKRVEKERGLDRISRLQEELKKRREAGERIRSRLDSARDAENAAERELIRTEDVNEQRVISIEEDMDELLREIEDLSDDREEFWRVREELADENPKPEDEIGTLNDRIKAITRSIKNKRRDILHLKERRRHLIQEIRDARRKLREISLGLRELEEAMREAEVEMDRLGMELGDEVRRIEGRGP